VNIPRSIAEHPELNATDKILWALLKYRDEWRREWEIKYGEDPGPVSDVRLGQWINRSRWTVKRARTKLARLAAAGPVELRSRRKQRPRKKDRGYLHVILAEVRRLGVLAAMALAQLRGWSKRDDVYWIGQHVRVRARELAQHVGCCRKTASKLLRGLRDKFTDILWANGYAPGVRVLDEREREKRAHQSSKAPEPPRPPVPQLRLPPERPRFRHTPENLGKGYEHLFQVPT
jgi:hypothetical protein